MIGAAVGEIGRFVRIEAVSSLFETAPMYVEDQDAYVNAAMIGEWDGGPIALVSRLKEVEKSLGRMERIRFGPREIDLDLLMFGSLWLVSENSSVPIQVPHARISERRFVLAPLAEIAPNMELPGLGKVSELLLQTEEQANTVVKMSHAPLSIHGN